MATRGLNEAIVDAEIGERLRQVHSLFEEYAASLDTDLCFQGFADELATLPGAYARPSGRLLLALHRATRPGAWRSAHSIPVSAR